MLLDKDLQSAVLPRTLKALSQTKTGTTANRIEGLATLAGMDPTRDSLEQGKNETDEQGKTTNRNELMHARNELNDPNHKNEQGRALVK